MQFLWFIRHHKTIHHVFFDVTSPGGHADSGHAWVPGVPGSRFGTTHWWWLPGCLACRKDFWNGFPWFFRSFVHDFLCLFQFVSVIFYGLSNFSNVFPGFSFQWFSMVVFPMFFFTFFMDFLWLFNCFPWNFNDFLFFFFRCFSMFPGFSMFFQWFSTFFPWFSRCVNVLSMVVND